VLDNKKNFNRILIAASVIFFIGMFYWLKPDGNWQGVKVISGDKAIFQLPDGSKAFLKGPSTLGYPKEFTEDFRRIKVEGSVYFEIVPHDTRPFLIQSEKGGLETKSAKVVINTIGKKNITIHCIEDSVRMIARGKTEIFEIHLGPYEMSSFTKGDKQINKQHFDSLNIQSFR
jgi:ferric-dicitrate binding protein FerR (iron transport regulator)